jgi:predicted nucleic acid-binding protein
MLLDTSGLLALLSVREANHAKAKELFTQSIGNLTHNYIVAELVALATVRGIPRQSLLDFVTSLMDVPEIEMVWVDENLHRRGMQLLSERIDKTYSLCDAVSFVLMGERSILDALTTDHHFAQEGLQKLLP